MASVNMMETTEVGSYSAMNQSLSSSSVSFDKHDQDLIREFFEANLFPRPVEVTLYVVYSLLTVSGFLFNFLMILVILKSESLRRMPFNLLLLNLCTANILMSVFCMPFTLIGFLHHKWTLGPALCTIIPTLQVSLWTRRCNLAILSSNLVYRTSLSSLSFLMLSHSVLLLFVPLPSFLACFVLALSFFFPHVLMLGS